jgi:hypothetical protein
MWNRFHKQRPELVSMAPEHWRERLSELCEACIEGVASEATARLREAFALFSLAPEESVMHGAALPRTAAFEAMLACGAEESAALALLPKGSGFLLSRGEDGLCLASVMLGGAHEEVTAQGATPALAMLATMAAALFVGSRGAEAGALAEVDGLILPEANWLN